MGSNWSSLEREPSPDPWWPTQEMQSDHRNHDPGEEVVPEGRGSVIRGKVREDEIEAFKQELARKRALRHEALAALQTELRDLRKTVEEERKLRIQAEEERDKLQELAECEKKSIVVEEEIKVEMKKNLQAENKVLEETNSQMEELREKLKEEREEKKKLLEQIEQFEIVKEEKSGLERQIQALKDVSQIGKEMLRIRELQVKELKKKLVELNMSTVMSPPEDLRVEYEKQIENIRKLRTLYEERAAATQVEHQRSLEREEAKITVLETKLSDLQKETEEIREVKNNLEGKIETLEKTIQHKEVELETIKDDLISSTVQNKSLNSQMSLINNLFSQMLVSPKVDLDRLIRLLKDNHGLITDLTMKGDSNEVAALLVDLAEQVENEEKMKEKEEKGEENEQSVDTTESEVVDDNVEKEISINLSKVWRVIIELLSHHQNPTHTELAGGADSCYKCVQTPSGPRSVISVSQTFLTLKDLILEKNQLVKEVGRLKTLNNHLEHRLGSQEKRLSVVTTELRKTWGVVNKLKAQHKQLHTHEKILRYELQQKRCMLTELKQELEYCKDKWEKARQKNSETEEDWKKLRKEFAARKTRTESNSAESGYEEDDSAQSPPSEPINESDLFKMKQNEGNEAEVSEDDIEHSDGNSFDTVIDLLDITCLENQPENNNESSLLLVDVQSEPLGVSPNLLPLTSSDFTEGLDQIESEDLASVLDIQYQNQLLGADYNLSLPSSSVSSPVPTENDDFASSEMEISEEDSSSQDNNICAIMTQPQMPTETSIPEDTLLFGSNSSQNISKFLDGLFGDTSVSQSSSSENKKLSLLVPSFTHATDISESVTPLVENCRSPNTTSDSATPLVGSSSFEFPNFNTQINETESNQTDSDQNDSSEPNQNLQELMLQAREDRLKRLEKQCRSIVSKVTSTSFRNEVISSKQDELPISNEPTTESSDTSSNVVKTRNVEPIGLFQQQAPQVSSTGNDTSKKCSSQKNQSCSSAKVEETLQSSTKNQGRTAEQILEARAARLKRLEEQCKSLFSKMSATSTRSDLISNKLDELHESYGAPEHTSSPTSKVCPPFEVPSNTDQGNSLAIASGFEGTSSPKTSKKFRDSEPPELALESKELLNKCSLPGPSMEPISINSTNYGTSRTPEQILEARAERLKRLEEQCKSLVSTMTATSLRSEIIANKLDELHSCYGSSEDASDNDDQSSSVSEESKTSTPTSSPRHARRVTRWMETDKQTQSIKDQENTPQKIGSTTEDLNTAQTTKSTTESVHSSNEISKRTPEEILKTREDRLKRMEEQCKSLFSKMSATSERSNAISSKLEDLHEQYGQTTSSQINNFNPPSTSSEENPQPTHTDTESSRIKSQIESSKRPIDENNVPSLRNLQEKDENCSASEENTNHLDQSKSKEETR